MVKPPKTMQPEAVKDLNKAGRSSTKSFGQDSFHNYMARKISMQRQQFGLMVPPPPLPPPASPSKNTNINNSSETRINSPQTLEPTKPPSLPEEAEAAISPVVPPTAPDVAPQSSRPRKSPASLMRKKRKYSSETAMQQPPMQQREPKARRVSFAPGLKQAPAKTSREKRQEQRGSQNPGVGSILNRLKKRHGRHRTSDLLDDSLDLLTVNYDGSCKETTYKDSSQESSQSLPDNNCNSPARTQTFLHKQKDNSVDTPSDTVVVADEKEGDSNLEDLSPILISHDTRSDLFFMGVVVMVNGDTSPDAENLQRTLHRHGGDLEKYETTRITHIVAEHLSQAKATMYKKQRNPRPVVYPSWIVDSIAAQRKLPASSYLIKEFRKEEEQTQKAVTSFFRPLKTMRNHSDTVEPEKPETYALKRPTLSETPPMDVEIVASPTRTSSPLSDASRKDEISPSTLTPTSKLRSASMSKPNKSQESEQNHFLQSPAQNSNPGKNGNKGRTDEKYINGCIRTVGNDPLFLDSFFRNSRLSYIGSFQQRRKSRSNHSSKKGKTTGQRFVFHVDFDFFFCAVALRKFPQHRNDPVVISHHGKSASNPTINGDDSFKNSTSECATCNYEARKYGIKKGMYLGRAKELCPSLVVLAYDFEGYKEVTSQMSDILHRTAEDFDGVVEEVSCDESYMELFIDDENKAAELAESIRNEIFAATDCTCTVGVAANKFLSKLATDHVKPNGSFLVKDHRKLLRPLKLRDLHGIGYRSEPKLAESGFVTVEDVWNRATMSDLQMVLGEVMGKKIWNFCQGQDDRPVEQAERKTIGAECNYGVRFDGPYGVDHLIKGLAAEVEARMESCGVKGAKVTLKVKKRKPGAGPPPKFLGHGSCFNLSKSHDTPVSTRDRDVLARIGCSLFSQLQVPKDDVRGMGLVVSNLVADQDSSTCGGIRKFFQTADSPNANRPRNKPSRYESDPSLHHNTTRQIEEDNDSEAELDLDLPNLSQLHMSQVDQLPSPYRSAIMKKVVRAKLKTEDSWTTDASNEESRTQHTIEGLFRRHETHFFDEDEVELIRKPKSLDCQGKERDDDFEFGEGEEERPHFPADEVDSSDFFRENVLPLSEFLDDHPPDAVSIERVVTFFQMLLDDERLLDIRILLRTIKNRSDSWGTEEFESLLKTVNTRVIQTAGMPIDDD